MFKHASRKLLKPIALTAILLLGAQGSWAEGPVDLNTADVETLQTLHGIGEVRAADIVAYREKHQGFKSVDELVNISGIGEKTLERIRDQVTVSGDGS
ncbi:MAG: ComEA family DNA-binding protein [Halothiobacillaceae bacterium]